MCRLLYEITNLHFLIRNNNNWLFLAFPESFRRLWANVVTRLKNKNKIKSTPTETQEQETARRFSYLFKFIRYSVMFHCLDLLSRPESREKEKEKQKKGTNRFTFTTNSPEFCLIRKRENWIHCESLFFKNKNTRKKKKNSRFCKCLFMITRKKTNSILDSVCSLSVYPSPHSQTLGWRHW